MSGSVAVIDYGTGNLTSICRAFARVGVEAKRVTSPAAADKASHLVLPGVGAFPKALTRLGELGFDSFLTARAAEGTPLLGVCLGMQLLFDSSSELGGSAGLGLISGQVKPLDSRGERLPHIGWSPVSWERDSALGAGLGPTTPMYHVHSFAATVDDPADLLATATHGAEFVTAVNRGSVYGVQFHPEKSSDLGLQLLKNFAGITP